MEKGSSYEHDEEDRKTGRKEERKGKCAELQPAHVQICLSLSNPERLERIHVLVTEPSSCGRRRREQRE